MPSCSKMYFLFRFTAHSNVLLFLLVKINNNNKKKTTEKVFLKFNMI